MSKHPGKVIGLKVESFRPEDSPKNIAIELAHYLQEEMNAKADAAEFRAQANRERQKCKGFNGTLTMLREYNRKKKKAIKDGQTWEPSRMEPMESYDEDMIKEERLMMLERANDLDTKANESDEIGVGAKRKSLELQKRLIEVSSK
jgi:hypothetical protein